MLTFSLAPLNISTPSKFNPVCHGGQGNATVFPSGGTQGYTYVWSPNGGTSATANVSAGSYMVKVTDANSCFATLSVEITEPSEIIIVPSQVNPKCHGGVGSANATVSGGTPGYTYSWSPSGGSAATANLHAGTFILTVTDANGCTKTHSYTISEPGN